MKKYRFTLLWLLFALALLLPGAPVRAQDDRPQVLVLRSEGGLTATMADYLARGLRLATQRNMEAVIFQLNTPGGALNLTERIVSDIRTSPIPVIVFVYPRGGMAGSAGTMITLAGHAAAMAPETSIGAASPISSEGTDLDETSSRKAKEITKAMVRGLAERRGPEAVALAEDTIENAKAASANEAYAIGLVDFIANDVDDLLAQADGFIVITTEGERLLRTANAIPVELPNTLIEQLLLRITDPNIVFLLLTIGVQAILIELSSPGGWVAGFIGVVLVAFAVYGLGFLPINWFGIAFLIIAFVLFILEIKTPTSGALTVAGVGSFIVGALVLFNSPGVPSFQRVSVPLVVGMGVLTAALFLIVVTFAIRAQKLAPSMGREAYLQRTGVVKEAINPVGTVQLGGELWTAELAEGEEPLLPGTRVAIDRMEGIRLMVRKAGEGK